MLLRKALQYIIFHDKKRMVVIGKVNDEIWASLCEWWGGGSGRATAGCQIYETAACKNKEPSGDIYNDIPECKSPKESSQTTPDWSQKAVG